MKQEIVITQDSCLLTALKQLDNLRGVSFRILLVADDAGKIIGTLTDGDIRRAIITHENLALTVGSICNPTFSFEYNRGDYVQLAKYKQNDLTLLPILNEDKTLHSFIDLKKQQAKLPLECMIMAGGRGKRLSPLTDTVPKPMLKIGGKPIIEHNIDRLISFGIQKIYISVKYLGEQIVEYFGDGSSKGITIEYIWEDEPLGTAGALGLVKNFATDNVLLMNSDLLTSVNFESLYLKLIDEKADMAVASTEYKVDVPYAIFDTDGSQVKAFKEKPSYHYQSNAGIYILNKNLITNIPKNTFYDITDLMENLIAKGGKLVYDPIIGYWIDIGSPADYQQAQEFIKHSL